MRARKLLDRFDSEEVKKIIFTDEKDFTIEVAKNRQNDVVYGPRKSDIPLSRLYTEVNRFSRKIMVSAGVSWEGKTKLHFIDTQTTKVNSESYIMLLKDKLFPDFRKLYPTENFIFQQDGATSHTSKATQEFLTENGVHFIKKR